MPWAFIISTVVTVIQKTYRSSLCSHAENRDYDHQGAKQQCSHSAGEGSIALKSSNLNVSWNAFEFCLELAAHLKIVVLGSI